MCYILSSALDVAIAGISAVRPQALYVIHLSMTYRLIFELANRIISPKFASKLHYLSGLEDLDQIISLAQLNIPQPVVDYELQSSSNKPMRRASQAATYKAPNPISLSLVFGRKLKDLAAVDKFRSDSTQNIYVPAVVRQLVEHLRQEGMDQVGIFRKSPSSTELQMVKAQFDQGEEKQSRHLRRMRKSDIHLGLEVDLSKHDVNVSASLLKVFLRDLPEPLITTEFVKEVGDLSGTTSYSDELVDRVRSKLEGSHEPLRIGLLCYLFGFLGEVAEHSKVNLMTVQNLAIVFSPNLIRDANTPPINGYGPVINSLSQDALATAAHCVKRMNESMGLVRMMILERERIFHADGV
ncbi:Rho GTPase-activating protein 1 [Apophysomyces ossiformis]|uniref:Rho GTPase-activating protein 1 n=1 Tax=Apophysomyces ossiformis TaxID=679940 RepID=A0A8H7BZB4_9FUNG|nr:Rho GTPase-activating protein 1 [Apophysomyces ossiformis]